MLGRIRLGQKFQARLPPSTARRSCRSARRSSMGPSSDAAWTSCSQTNSAGKCPTRPACRCCRRCPTAAPSAIVKRWPGTIALDPAVMTTLITQIGTWAYHSGVRRLFIVNTHVTNFAPLRCALENLRATFDDLMVCVINTGQMTPRVKAVHFADGDDWHANDAETSLMLAVRRRSCARMKSRRPTIRDRTEGLVFSHPVNRTSKNGVTGYPSRATKKKGEDLFQMMVEDLSDMVRRGIKETPPLDASYHTRRFPAPDLKYTFRGLAMAHDPKLSALMTDLKARGVKYCMGAMWTSTAARRARWCRSTICITWRSGSNFIPATQWTAWGRRRTTTSSHQSRL